MRPLLASWFILCAALPLAAGSMQVRVTDGEGHAVRDATVRIAHSDPTLRNARRTGVTDASGTINFDGLPTGQYTINVIRSPDPLLVPPYRNPLVPSTKASLMDEAEAARVTVVLQRGAAVSFRLNVDVREERVARVLVREIDVGHEFHILLRSDRDDERVLVPGRWEILLDPPPAGLLLRDMELDGRSLSGHRALLEVTPTSPAHFVTWYLSGPSTLRGTVDFEGTPVSTFVEATLIEAGGWLASVSERGGSKVDRVRRGVDTRTGRYEMHLPDGTWQVRAAGDLVEWSEPGPVTLTLAPGEDRSQDFVVRGRDREGRWPMFVVVRGSNGERIDRALVEVWPLAEADRGEKPVDRVRAGGSMAWLRKVPAGDFMVAAAHEDYLEGSVEVHGFDPSAERREPVEVRLHRGVEIKAAARDADKNPVAGVTLELRRVDPPPPTLITHPRVRGKVAARAADTDETGHLVVTGLWPGRYRLGAVVRAGEHAGRFVELRAGSGSFRKELEIELAGSAPQSLDLLVKPAANLGGRPVCLDDRSMPGAIAVIVVPGTTEIAEIPRARWEESAVFDVSGQPLAGGRRERFTVGPLPPDAYFVAVKPSGFDRWTWAPGGEHPRDATSVSAGQEEVTDLGTIGVDCGPAIRLEPVVAGEGVPERWRALLRETTLASIAGVVERDGRERKIESARLEHLPGEILLRDLPEGNASVEVTIRNGFFLPAPTATARVEGPLEPGRTLTGFPEVRGIGGMVRLSARGLPAARLVVHGEPERVQVAERGAVLLESVPAGTHRVELCADAACDSILQILDAVVVEAGEVSSPLGE